MDNETRVSNINIEAYSLFDVTCAELIATALENVGLLRLDTLINGKNAAEFCKSFQSKRENFKEATKLGNLLVKYKIITQNQLHEALNYQRKNPEVKLGTILMKFKFCSFADIEKFLYMQVQIRDDLQEIDDLVVKMATIRKRLLQPLSPSK
ncbi:MAG: hypothetical protein A2287_07845 [Candidatus Melainabacteria bacterium RIFOXYA12_FULL_32_12]|nr:MAG: hypothetical protein A2104_08990 [Candidatus Melainabacteria bacterium GWF2_32_7]OGI20325.1 MAG: hypothetical protein A2255_10465 [Candidatus Melainabacteria bacterium RIFOXYA2_FULL_32_9]OGI28252.1 MAG: hypothetical protein A2287_07845 [Candidatus Melainabacteria bacterium RIFOXYA12_FULL_32_12]